MGGSGLRGAGDGFGGDRSGDKKSRAPPSGCSNETRYTCWPPTPMTPSTAYPSLSAARDKVAKLCGDEVAQALVDDNPRAIISDKPLPYFPNPVMKKRERSRLDFGRRTSDVRPRRIRRVLDSNASNPET